MDLWSDPIHYMKHTLPPNKPQAWFLKGRMKWGEEEEKKKRGGGQDIFPRELQLGRSREENKREPPTALLLLSPGWYCVSSLMCTPNS